MLVPIPIDFLTSLPAPQLLPLLQVQVPVIKNPAVIRPLCTYRLPKINYREYFAHALLMSI